MSRQPPTIRAGSGDSHEARLAVLEQRFSQDMQARCSWCNKIKAATNGDWLEVVLSTPGTGIATSHVFRCQECEQVPVRLVGTGVVAVPRRTARAASAAGKEAGAGPFEGVIKPAGAPEAQPAAADTRDLALDGQKAAMQAINQVIGRLPVELPAVLSPAEPGTKAVEPLKTETRDKAPRPKGKKHSNSGKKAGPARTPGVAPPAGSMEGAFQPV